MEGFILAAGLGTRLRPLTDDRPKALVEVDGVTLLERTIRRLESAGINHIVINVHHFAEKVVDFLSGKWKVESATSHQPPATGYQLPTTITISNERDLLLDTGGGLKHAAPLFSGRENILIHNVDILSDINLREVERKHEAEGNLVTLCVSQRQTKRMLEFDEAGMLVGRATQDTLLSQPQAAASSPNLGEQQRVLAFSGISIVSPELFALLPEADRPYPVIDEYIRLSQAGHRIGAYLHDPAHWLDVGKPETLKQAEQWTVSSVK